MSNIKRVFPVMGMGCAACAGRIESAVRGAAGVEAAAVNFAASNIVVEFDPSRVSPEGLRDVVRAAGYDMSVGQDADAAEEDVKKK